MLFSYDKPQEIGIWMKDMKFDLDMVWLDKDFKVVHIENALARSYNAKDPSNSKIFTSGEKMAKYVLEINMGLAKKMGLKVGDILTLK